MPLTSLLAIATLLSGLKTRPEHRKWRITGTVLILLVVGFTFVWFIPNIIKLLGEGVTAMSPDEITTLTSWWVGLNWVRAVLFLAAWLAVLRVLTVPPKLQNGI